MNESRRLGMKMMMKMRRMASDSTASVDQPWRKARKLKKEGWQRARGRYSQPSSRGPVSRGRKRSRGEMADAHDSESCGATHGGSSPLVSTLFPGLGGARPG